MNKVWTYIIDRALSDSQLQEMISMGNNFVSEWTAHENKLHASFEIFKRRIIIVKVDENVYSASGCSIDKLLRFIKTLETKFQIQLLNRLLVAYDKGNEIGVSHSSGIQKLLEEKTLDENSMIYNTSISSENELQNWKLELKNSWLNKYLVKV